MLSCSNTATTQQLTREKPGRFVEKHYPIPADLLQSDRLAAKFAAKQWLAGGVYDLRLLKPDAPESNP